MTLLSDIQIAPTENVEFPGALNALRDVKTDRLATTALPTRKTESWKYSAKYLGAFDKVQPPRIENSEYSSDYDLDCYTIELFNGTNGGVITGLPEGVSVTPFNALSESQSNMVSAGVTAKAEHLPFADLNTIAMENGLFIDISANTRVEKPIRIVALHNGAGMSQPRLFINVGKLAAVQLIHEFHGSGDDVFINSVEDIHVNDGADCTYIRMNLNQRENKLVGATGVALSRDARFNSHNLALGCALGRHDFQVELQAPGAECDLNAVTVTQGKQHFDHHTSIEHIAPNCTSNENYRCIAGDTSHIVFNGRIHIHRDAQKTLGAMSNKNLILSTGAEIDSKPELEIYADDVKCAHGTTIGQLNEKEVYYLKTRGMPDEQARQMLTLGFVLEIVHANPIEEICDYWESLLSNLLSFESNYSTAELAE